MYRAYKYRFYPTKAQKVLLDNTFGCCRFVYNWAIDCKKNAYAYSKVNYSAYDLINALPFLKERFPWLKKVSNPALQSSILNLESAYKMFFKKHNDFPKFKKKHSNQSFKCPNPDKIKFKGDRIQIPKFVDGIKFVEDRKFSGTMKSATVRKTPTGKYYISITVDTNTKPPKQALVKAETTVGIDVGIKSFYVDSEGNIIENPKYLKDSLKRLKSLQRRASRNKKGSKNRVKANKRLATCHEKVANQRKDFLHKVSTNLVKNHDTICMEDLRVENMVKNHKLAQSISDASWSMFRAMVTYKAEWAGKNVLLIPAFAPSTKICSDCDAKIETLTLKDRSWICPNCGVEHDRDHNAAKSIKKYCLTHETPVGSGVEPVELLTLVGAKKQEGKTSVQ